MSPIGELDVYLGSDRVGTLVGLGPSRIRLEYTEAVVTAFEGQPLLSASLPVRAERYSNRECRPFFEGLLPEGHVRDLAAAALRVGRDSTYHLLAALGADCAGAVVLLPAGSPSPDAGGSVIWLEEDELEAKLVDLPRTPLGIDPEHGVRASLAGAQDKLVIVRAPTGRYGQPAGGAPSTHIIKPNPQAYENLVENELLGLRVARCLDLPAARADRVRIGDVTALLVERFDRTIGDGGRITRVHQEDFCQALGRMPDQKYEEHGGPSVVECVELIRAVSTMSGRDVATFLDALLLNALLGNSDAHAKNYGFLYEETASPRLAPLYDLVSTTVYTGLITRTAMTIGGQDDPDAMTLDAWRQLGADIGLGIAAFVRRVADQARVIAACAQAQLEAARAEGWHVPLLDDIAADVTRRAGALTP